MEQERAITNPTNINKMIFFMKIELVNMLMGNIQANLSQCGNIAKLQKKEPRFEGAL